MLRDPPATAGGTDCVQVSRSLIFRAYFFTPRWKVKPACRECGLLNQSCSRRIAQVTAKNATKVQANTTARCPHIRNELVPARDNFSASTK